MNTKYTDEFYMRRALALARKGEGRASPNPMVGAVIVKNGRIMAEGYHRVYGGPHAEINAIRSARETIEGSSLYITLEPCTHTGKTPPCIESILKARPAEVIIGSKDPNPLVAGRGIRILKRQGIETRVGILEEDCRNLNEKFFRYIRTLIPFVTVKFAQSLDGRIATGNGDSKWISSEASRKLAHRERALHDAVLVGAGTVLADDPELTVRLARGKNPVRIVLDAGLRIPLGARVLRNQASARTILATAQSSRDKRKTSQLSRAGIDVLFLPEAKQGGIDPAGLLAALGKQEISSLLVEGGSKIITLFLKSGLADRLLIFTAPRIIGAGIEAVGDLGTRQVRDALRLDYRKVFRSGPDIVVDARIKK